jgi:hypothetical protein
MVGMGNLEVDNQDNSSHVLNSMRTSMREQKEKAFAKNREPMPRLDRVTGAGRVGESIPKGEKGGIKEDGGLEARV